MNKSWNRPFSEYYLYDDRSVKYGGIHYADKNETRFLIVKVWEDGRRIAVQKHKPPILH